jgi:Tol biopolymer transport system component
MAAAAVAAVALAGAGWWYARQPEDSAPISLDNVQVTRLTDSGEASAVAISPDGRYVSYVQGTPDRQSLWVRQIATSSDLQIQPADAVRYTGVAFSRDGNYIYFTRSDRSTFLYNYLYVIPSLGGTPRQLVKDVDTAVGFSPDGKRIAFIRGAPDQGKELLVVANADGSGEKVLWSASADTSSGAMTAPDWSPDGAHIAIAWADRQVLNTGTITIVDAETGEGAALLHHQGRVGRARWLADGKGLLIPLDDRMGERAQIYHVTYPGGALRRVTNDLADYSRQHFDMTADGRTLAIVQETHAFNLEVADGGGRESTQIVSGGNMTTFAWGPDGRIYYAAGGQIYRIDHDGSNRTAVTGNGVVADAARPCGTKDIVFINHESDASSLSRVDADGSNVRRIAPTVAGAFDCAFDGSFVVFAPDAAGGRVLMRAALDGSAPRQIVDRISGPPAVSPDGTMVAVQYWRTFTADGVEMGVFSMTGEKLQVVPLPGTSRGQAIWSPDGKALQYLVYRGGGANIWEQPIVGGPPRQVTSFSSKPITSWAWSHDGKQLAILQGRIRTDVVLMSGFN